MTYPLNFFFKTGKTEIARNSQQTTDTQKKQRVERILGGGVTPLLLGWFFER